MSARARCAICSPRCRRSMRASVIDLGCGPGNSTEVLAARFPARAHQRHRQLVGHDRGRAAAPAADTISRSRTCRPGALGQGPFDVILANAVLQWVPNHEALLPALIARLAPGGALAVQMPDNLEEPAHRLMREIAGEDRGPPSSRLCRQRATVPCRARLVLRTVAAALLEGRSVADDLLSLAARRARRPWWNGSKAAACGRFSSR